MGAAAPTFDRRRVVHPSKPVWFERTKTEAGTWTAIPHYGKAITVPPAPAFGAYTKPRWF